MSKAQSAMEYLTTYGWAILIIAAVFASLWALGVFNINSGSGALAGSCQVYRPYGAGTSQLLDLQGLCNNQQPKYTAYFNGGANVLVPASGLTIANSITVTAWVRVNSNSNPWVLVDRGNTGSAGSFYIGTLGGASSAPTFTIYSTSGTAASVNFGSSSLNPSSWYYLVATFNPSTGNQITYVNGVLSNYRVGSGSSLGTSSANIVIGNYTSGADGLVGYIGDVQMYNTSLSANEIRNLYIEGVGGAPIQLQNLVGWWVLNGDTKDYSGNGDNAVSNGISFNPGWSTTYTTP